MKAEPSFQITLQLICNANAWVITSEVVTGALELCLGTFASSTDAGVRMASRAATSQILTSYCTTLYKEQVSSFLSLGKGRQGRYTTQVEDADFINVFQEVTSLLSYAVKRLASMSSVDDNPALLLAVDSVTHHAYPSLLPLTFALSQVLSILQSQSSLEIAHYEPLATLVWQELSPALIALLGLPGMSQAAGSGAAPGDGGRGASAVGSSALLEAPDVAKSVHTLCGELLRLFGSSAEMRSVLESLFHRLFLFPPPEQRGEVTWLQTMRHFSLQFSDGLAWQVLQSFKKILGTPSYLLAFFAAATEPDEAPVYDPEQPLNLNLWKMLPPPLRSQRAILRHDFLSVLDSLVECCGCNSVSVVAAAIEVVEGVVAAWARLCEGPDSPLPPSVADALNRRFKSLRHADLPAFAYPKGAARPLMLTSLLSGMGGFDSEDSLPPHPV